MGSKLVRNIAIGIGIYIVLALVVLDHFWPVPTDPAEMDWEQRQEFNLKQIANLELGMDKSALLQLLGPPDIKEAQLLDDGQLELMYYRTRHREADGETTPDECTPLLIKDGRLISLGEQALQLFEQQIEKTRDEQQA